MEEKQNTGGFKVPERYFDNLKGRLLDAVSESSVQLPEKDGFVAPADYFETLTGRIMQQVAPPQPKVFSLHNYKKYMLVAAAAAVIAVLFFLVPETETPKPGFDDIAGTDIATYMEFSELDLTADEIAQLFPIGEIEVSDILDDSLGEEQIMDYLNTSMEDYEELNYEIDE